MSSSFNSFRDCHGRRLPECAANHWPWRTFGPDLSSTCAYQTNAWKDHHSPETSAHEGTMILPRRTPKGTRYPRRRSLPRHRHTFGLHRRGQKPAPYPAEHESSPRSKSPESRGPNASLLMVLRVPQRPSAWNTAKVWPQPPVPPPPTNHRLPRSPSSWDDSGARPQGPDHALRGLSEKPSARPSNCFVDARQQVVEDLLNSPRGLRWMAHASEGLRLSLRALPLLRSRRRSLILRGRDIAEDSGGGRR